MMSYTKHLLFTKLALIVFALLAIAKVSAQHTAHDLIERMLDVSIRLNYSGVFSYESVGSKRIVKVSHQVLDGHAYERIAYQDAVIKDRLRKSLIATCTPNNAGELQLRDNYRFIILGEYRVAGRQAYKIQVMPLDKLRYGYQFGVDQQSGLMLQSTLISQSGQPLERFKYVDIELESPPAAVSEIRFYEKFMQLETDNCAEDGQQQTNLIPLKWVAKWSPPGFFRSAQKVISEDRVSVVYTDGISVFSVLIDRSPAQADNRRLSAQVGPTQMLTAYYRHNGVSYRITASGQMPKSTLNRVVLSVRPMASDQMISSEAAGQ